MPTRKLPKKNSPALQDAIEEYKQAAQRGDIATLNELALKWGYANRETYERAMRMHTGIYIGQIPAKEIEGLDELEEQVLKIVKTGAVSVGEISRRIDRSAETVIKTMDALREGGYDVQLDDVSRLVEIPQIPNKEFAPTAIKYFRKFYRIGLVSDTQICSRYQQMTLLHDAYKDFDDRQVDFILHAGDLGDGENMYKGHGNEIFKHGADMHEDYIIENYPRSGRNRKTYVIGGQHDFCWYKQSGRNIIRSVCEKRKDLVYRGFFDADFTIKSLGIKLHHPGGGVAYARSYKLQKYIENLIGYITSIPSTQAPALLFSGHVHIPVHLPLYMGIDAASLPCFQSQTPYLAEKGLMPVVGYAVAEIYLDDNNNLTSSKIEFINLNAHIRRDDY